MRIFTFLFLFSLGCFIAQPVFAQDRAFYETMQFYLPASISASTSDALLRETPSNGDVESVSVDTSYRSSLAEPYEVQSFGRDNFSNYLSAAGVLFGLIMVVIIFVMVLSYRHTDHHPEKESSKK